MTNTEIGLCNGIIHTASAAAGTAAGLTETIGWILANEFEKEAKNTV